METLSDMDIVLFSPLSSSSPPPPHPPPLQLGAVQEDGTLAPLSAWTDESPFDGSDVVEFVVDEHDRWLPALRPENVVVHAVVDGDGFGYGSRQVGGGKGLGNPHGEESELLYYVERGVLEDFGVEVILKPELEILW